MTDSEHRRVMNGFSEIISTHAWERIGDYVHPDAVWEYPQSGERFRGLENIRAQFANYPGLGPGTTQLEDVIGEPAAFALTPSYTVIGVDGTGDRGTAIVRVRYPDGSLWYAINVYELRDGLIGRSRSYFAPDFEAPDWRAPYREAP
ncbi:MAG TPA: nuclear transport factor 2 family protein [Candidatus Limnocylindria bacterium]|nr:nuclear transport factor 2 family protein [Candidatus Limnocylindria bacterium]